MEQFTLSLSGRRGRRCKRYIPTPERPRRRTRTSRCAMTFPLEFSNRSSSSSSSWFMVTRLFLSISPRRPYACTGPERPGARYRETCRRAGVRKGCSRSSGFWIYNKSSRTNRILRPRTRTRIYNQTLYLKAYTRQWPPFRRILKENIVIIFSTYIYTHIFYIQEGALLSIFPDWKNSACVRFDHDYIDSPIDIDRRCRFRCYYVVWTIPRNTTDLCAQKCSA